MAETQQALWHDRFDDALRSCAEFVGGPDGGLKVVAAKLWPGKDPQDAARLLSHCLDPERQEKLALGEIVRILKWAREANCHIGMTYLGQECGYQDPIPVEPEDERAALQREAISAVKQLEQLTKRLERLNGR